MKINTGIPATDKRLSILGSVIGQLSDGIWENTRSMEKYWRSLSYEKGTDGNIWLEDRGYVCANVVDFFANKIKQIIKIEIEDGYTKGLEWSRTCSVIPSYIHGGVTVGDCYELYELLKGRKTDKNTYSTYSDYSVDLEYGGMKVNFVVSALNEYEAKEKAIKKLSTALTARAYKV